MSNLIQYLLMLIHIDECRLVIVIIMVIIHVHIGGKMEKQTFKLYTYQTKEIFHFFAAITTFYYLFNDQLTNVRFQLVQHIH